MRAPTVTEEAVQTANVTAERARVHIETVADPRRLASVAELFASVWGSGPGQEPIAVDVLRALAHSGGAVHVAYGPDRASPAGAAVAVFGSPRSRTAYSLIAGAAKQGGGLELMGVHQ